MSGIFCNVLIKCIYLFHFLSSSSSPCFFFIIFAIQFGFVEIRSGIFATATMVRSETEIWKSIAIWLFKCNSPSWRYLVTWYLFHYARWFQRPPHTNAFCLKNLSQRHNQLFDEVRKSSHICETKCNWN